MSATYNNPVTPAAAVSQTHYTVDLRQKFPSLEGTVATLNTLAGWLYLVLAHSITSGVAWLLFLCGLSAFLLSIFASARQSRWWFAVTLISFVLLMTLSHATEGCASNPCPL